MATDPRVANNLRLIAEQLLEPYYSSNPVLGAKLLERAMRLRDQAWRHGVNFTGCRYPTEEQLNEYMVELLNAEAKK
jgi:hypothetical protein